MRRNEFQAIHSDGVSYFLASAASPPGRFGWFEPNSSSPVVGDLTDDMACSWESAWIDLGGEG